MKPLLWSIIAAGPLLAVASWTRAVPPVEPPDAVALTTPRALQRLDRPALTADGARLLQGNPFRSARRPTDVRYNPWEPVYTPVTVAPPVRPMLTLAGILGGPPWNAVIQGIPGKESGIVLRIGETVNGFQLVSIRGDTVRIAGQDTTWILNPKPAWP